MCSLQCINLKLFILIMIMGLMTSLSRKFLPKSMRYTSSRLFFNSIQKIYDSLTNISTNEFKEAISDPLNSSHLMQCLEAMDTVSLDELGFNDEEIAGLEESVCANIVS